MILLIDGYNVLKLRLGGGHLSAAQRNAFVRQVERYVTSLRHEAIIVFDGERAEDDYGSKPPVQVLYAGHRRTADQLITELCYRYRNQEQLVISSDRDICHVASSWGITCMDADGFLNLLAKPLQETKIVFQKSQGTLQKRPGHASNPELDALMGVAGRVVQIKPEDEIRETSEDQALRGKKLSKYERKVTKLVRKL